MNWLITGATGFIGSHLIENLLQDNQVVHVIVRNIESLDKSILNRVIFHNYNGSLASVREAVQESSPDLTVHLATKYITEHKGEDLESLINSNILFGMQLVEQLSYLNSPSFINFGTTWQNFNSDEYKPVNLYAATKQAFQDMIEYYSESKKLRTITLKLSDTYGPNDKRGKLLTALIKSLDSEHCFELSPGEQSLNLLHVIDVVQAIRLAALQLEIEELGFNNTYNLTSKESLNLKELIQIIQEISGKRLNVKLGAKSYRQREVMTPIFPHDQLPNWKQTIHLFDGIKELIYEES